MTRGRRLAGAAAVALTLLTVLGAPGTALAGGAQATPTTTAPASGGTDTAITGDVAVDDLADCIQANKQLLVVFLIDQSGSLGKSDKEARRVDAAKAALDSVVSLTEGGESERARVDATFAAFSNAYYPVKDWTQVTAANQGELATTLDSFRKKNQGTDTDFVNALAGANEELTKKSAQVQTETGQKPCKAIVLFTDGQYDIGVRDPSNVERLGKVKDYAPDFDLTDEAGVVLAENAGKRALCDEGGVADAVRDNDVTLLTIALTGSRLAEQQDLLTAVSVGQSGAVNCGRPVNRPPGAYVSADNVGSLVARFDEVATRVAGGVQVADADDRTLVLCGAEPCAAGTRTVAVDQSVRRFRILALAADPGMVVQIESPGGSVTIEEATTTKVGSAPVRARDIAGRGFGIDVDRPPGDGDWTGQWKFILLDPSGKNQGKPATFTYSVFTDVGVDFTGGKVPQLVRGSTVPLSASLVVPDGSSTKMSEAKVVLRLDDPVSGKSTEVELTGPANGPYLGTYAVPLGYRSNYTRATLELDGTTTTDAKVVTRSAPRDILVKRPAGSIQFAPASLELPAIEGTGTSEADLIAIGGEKDGCVWFGQLAPEDYAAPEDAGEITVTYNGKSAVSEASCVAVKAGTTIYVAVEVAPSDRATGAVRGVIEVHEKVEGAKETVTDVQFSLDLTAGIDQGRRLLLAVLLLAGGLLLPLLLLMVINAVTARFQDLNAVRGASIPVRIDGKRVWRFEQQRWTGFYLKDTDFRSLADSGDPRQFTFGGIVFRARPSRNPLGASMAMAAPEGGAERLKGGVGSRVELDLGLTGSWVFLLDPDKTRRVGREGVAEGSLIAFIAEGESGPQIARMNPDLDKRLPTVAADLARIVRESKPNPDRTARKARRHRGPEPADEPGAHDEADSPAAEVVAPAEVGADDAPVGAEGPPPEPVGSAEPDSPAEPDGPGDPEPGPGDPEPEPDGLPGSAEPDEGPDDGPDDPGSGPAPLGFTGGPR